ncbi:MAG: hypothetical protein ACJ75P_13225 [Gaiellaceae bacterium]
MRRIAAVVTVAAVLVAAAADASATILPQKGMSGVALGMTTAQVRARLGGPIGTGGGRWYYARVWVGFRAGRAVEITTTRSTERTGGGLGVDSSESSLRASYPGLKCTAAIPFRRCRLGSGAPGTRVTDFMVGHGRVLQITIALLPA